MQNPITYRDARPADGPLLDAMARRIWVETFQHSCSAGDMALYLDGAYGSRGTLLRDLADHAHRFHLALAGEAIAAYAKLSPLWLDEAIVGAHAVQLSQLYVATPWHGAGIAQALMAWVIDTARRADAASLVLTVWEENARARRFYERYGFVQVGDYAFQTGRQVDRDLIMRLAL
ncbi:GNAT family N-acetyltransferase [Sphingomonas sp.]|uniref:GNAT family N-acetyltransferase n=1 Tax=Sphingomonas sp. TaxID=28214 RepID=UPI0035BC84C0